VLFAATCWAGSIILVRVVNRSETTTNQMLISNAMFALACAFALPFLWRMPDAAGFSLMVLLGIAGGFGQFLLFESFRYAPASVIAPIEYTALVWAFLFGWIIWSDVPPPQVFLGAALIVGSCLAVVWSQSRTRKP
jgi:S-adenosylmethionine uptake transporter